MQGQHQVVNVANATLGMNNYAYRVIVTGALRTLSYQRSGGFNGKQRTDRIYIRSPMPLPLVQVQMQL
ncbi:MAG: hypothetical protein IPP81_11405 [Chitinophagaceae bacterium]|nr:hypothetical protein [Chitinophagaceae bacterium]